MRSHRGSRTTTSEKSADASIASSGYNCAHRAEPAKLSTDGREVADDPTPAWTAWSALPERTRIEVGQLARLGVRHPNDEAAEAAGAWASVVLAAAGRERAEAWWSGLIVTSVFHLDPGVVAELANQRAWRAWAEQVLAANAGTHPPMFARVRQVHVPRWSEEERRRQLVVLLPVMAGLVGVLVFLAVVVAR